MSFDPTVAPGLGEARLDAIALAIKSNIAVIQNNLSRGGFLPANILDTTDVVIGDIDTPWALEKSGHPFRICVIGGGRVDGMDSKSSLFYIDQGAKEVEIYTNILAYLHPQWLADSTDPWIQGTNRERARARIVDALLYGIFNTPFTAPSYFPMHIQLASQVYNTGSAYDILTKSMIVEVRLGEYPKGPQGSIPMPVAHLLHRSIIA